jgi:uncharacterized protein (TIGR00290 family)
MDRIAVFWSGGKDSALLLRYLLEAEEVEVHSLVTTLNESLHRVTMHGTRELLIDQQAAAIGLPLHKMWMPDEVDNQTYEKVFHETLESLKEEGVTRVAFGDIFLQDIKEYREKLLKGTSLKPLFPLWQRDTYVLINFFLRDGFEALTTSMDESKLSPAFLARKVDSVFLQELPENVDPCGENGEFHTFVYNGPYFKNQIPFTIGERVSKHYGEENGPSFAFCDLIPEKSVDDVYT